MNKLALGVVAAGALWPPRWYRLWLRSACTLARAVSALSSAHLAIITADQSRIIPATTIMRRIGDGIATTRRGIATIATSPLSAS